MTARQQLSVVLLLAGVALVGITLGHKALGNELEPVGTGVQAPDFTAQTLDRPPRVKRLADYKHQVALLNVWATWCVPCRAEMPSIQRLYQAHASRGFKVVAVSIDDPGMEDGIRAFVRQLGLTFEVLHDPTGAIQQQYQMTGVPESFLIGRDGTIRKKIAGAIDWDSDANRRLIARLLAE
jgi:peroxiredoxin